MQLDHIYSPFYHVISWANFAFSVTVTICSTPVSACYSSQAEAGDDKKSATTMKPLKLAKSTTRSSGYEYSCVSNKYDLM
jgi:hypothetical protein